MSLYCRNHKPVDASVEYVIDFLVEFEVWARSKDDGFRIDNQYLIGYKNSLFRTYERIQVFEVKEFDAIGAGEEYAKTALHLGKTPEESVAIACELSVWCHLPVTTHILNAA